MFITIDGNHHNLSLSKKSNRRSRAESLIHTEIHRYRNHAIIPTFHPILDQIISKYIKLYSYFRRRYY